VKTAVTGGTGFVGSHLVEALLARGDQATCLVRSPEKAKGLCAGARPVVGVLDDAASLEALVAGAEVVYHVAGAVTANSAGDTHFAKVNQQGTENLARAAKKAGVRRFLYVSSLAASGPALRGIPLADAETCQPVTAYGRSKLAGEAAVRAAGASFTIVRPPSVYGPRDRNQFLPAFKLARSGWAPVLGDGLQELSLIHARDLAQALIAAALSPRTEGKTYHAAHPEVVTQRELVRAIGRALGKDVRIVPLPRPLVWALLYGVGTMADLVGSGTVLRPTKAPELFAAAWTCGSEPLGRDAAWAARIPLAEGLPETARWYREARWL
jgi:nucleoside-diphosphate-sugar epimerase